MSLPEWAQSLPTELQDAPHLSGAKDAEAWVNQLKTDSAWRAQSVRVPSEDADEETRKDFHEQLRTKATGLMATPIDDETRAAANTAMGKPDESSGYTVAEGVELDDIDSYREVAHSLDMTQRTFNDLISMEVSGRADRAAAHNEVIEGGYKSLQNDWGAAFEERYEQVGGLLKDAPEGLRDLFSDRQFPADQVKWLYSLVQLAGESAEVVEQRGSRTMTPEEASLELEDFKPVFYAMKKFDPGYKAAAAKVERLVKLRMGETA